MAQSPFRDEILEAKNRLLYLENKVEDFERQLREMAERMNQSIEQLSIDCELKCSRVWREFNAFMKEAQLKAEELCDDMRRKTTEQQIKWRFSLREKEDLLKEAGMWHNDLRHLLSAGNDNKDVVFGLHSVEAKLSSRLQESFDPVEGGHFVVTFPEWCQRSLNQLQKEIVDFTVGTWPTRSLELQSECYLPCSDMGISMITSSDKDGRLFAVDDGDGTVKEFTEFGRVVSRCSIENEENFVPFDICRLSNDTLVLCGILREGGLLFLTRKKGPPFLEKKKFITTKKKFFCCMCQMDEQIFACDLSFKEIVCFSKEGKKVKTIEIGEWPLPFSQSAPLLCADPTTGNLLGTRRGMLKFFVFNKNGQVLQTVETEEAILDLCDDGFGHFYFSTETAIFSVLPKKILYKFPKETESISRIFVSRKKLFVCFENDELYVMKIFRIN